VRDQILRASLILLLPVYSLLKQRRVGAWAWYLLIPVATLGGYQFWTKALYAEVLLWDAAAYARSPQHVDQASRLTSGLVGLSFLGGCALPILLFLPFLWNRRQLIFGSLAAAIAGLAGGMRWVLPLIHDPSTKLGLDRSAVRLYVAGGISVLGLVIADYRKRRDADSALLALWVLGTFLFAAFLNWTVTLARCFHSCPRRQFCWPGGWMKTKPESPPPGTRPECRSEYGRMSPAKLGVPLALSAAASLSIAWGDATLANSGRSVASLIHRQTQNQAASVLFEGHWGFQYYMQLFGARPVEYYKFAFQTGKRASDPGKHHQHIPHRATICGCATNLADRASRPRRHYGTGAGFYSSVWGPLPFSFGRIPSENYLVVRLQQPIRVLVRRIV